MKIKIKSDPVGICGSCRHASLAETRGGQLLARCDWFGRDIREPIVACSKHNDRRRPSLSDMRQTAWILRTDAKDKAIGFVSNQQWRRSKDYRANPFWGDEDD